jgi:hypothetical protein
MANQPAGEMSGMTNPNLPKVKWDDANMKSSYANVWNVTSTREEVILFFGMHQAWQSGQREVTVQITDRIVLSPFTAKRMVNLLGNVVKEYEKCFGSLSADASKS